MIFYAEQILKRIKKNQIPRNVFQNLDNAFRSLNMTDDFNLFDIKKLTDSENANRVYYRLRKGKYRAIFYRDQNDIYVIAIDKREKVYRKWQ